MRYSAIKARISKACPPWRTIKSLKGRDHRAVQPGQHLRELRAFRCQWAMAALARSLILGDQACNGNLGLADDECGDNAYPHARRHRQVGNSPWRIVVSRFRRIYRGGYPQGASGSQDHRHPITRLIGGSHGSLEPWCDRFDSISVQRDILGCGSESDSQRKKNRIASDSRRDRCWPCRPGQTAMTTCDSNSHARRRPSQRVNSGNGRRSTSGDHIHLKP